MILPDERLMGREIVAKTPLTGQSIYA